MRFSILIPVYNVEKYLHQCFDSVINQTYDDYEVIVVDDGSNDKSSSICDDFAENYPDKVTVLHKENQGLISARRVAIEEAQGEYCVFVDSDDFIENNLLETVDMYIRKEEKIDIVIYSFYHYCDGKKRRFTRAIAEDATVWSGESKRKLYELLVTCDVIDALWIKAIKTDLLRNDPIDYQKYYSKNMSEDVLQSLYPLTYAHKVIYADALLYDYRYNNASISRNYNPETITKKNSTHVFEEIFNIIPLWGLDDSEIKNKVYARWFSDVMYIFWKSCESSKSKEDWYNIFSADWFSMLPKSNVALFAQYVSPRYMQLYTLYIEKKFYKIRFSFFKKKIYKKIRAFLRKK